MQEFDYSNETSNDLYDAVDGLSYEEAVFAKEAIEKIKEEKEYGKLCRIYYGNSEKSAGSSKSKWFYPYGSRLCKKRI